MSRAVAYLLTIALFSAVSCREINVAAVDVFSVAIDPPTASIEVGSSIRFTATIRDELGRELIRTITWTSNAPAVLEIASTGEAVAMGAGDARVTARVEGHSATADVTVRPIPVAEVEVVPDAVSVAVGDSVQFQAVARASDRSVLSGRVPTWTSDDPGVLLVDVRGVGVGIAAGTTTVSADVDGVRGTASVTVQPRVLLPVAGVRIEPDLAAIAVGDSLQLRVVLTAGDGTELTGRTVEWSSDRPAVAAVGATGVVQALATGTAVITATSEGVSGQATVTVSPTPVASVVVTPAAANIFAGDSLQFQATLRAADGTVLTGRPIAWSSNNPQVASVSGSGMVKGSAAGTAIIRASSGGAIGTASITVTLKPVADVKITPVAPSVSVGNQLLLRATLLASDSSVLTGRLVNWSISDDAIATVLSNGPTTQAATLVAKTQGTALITALAEGQVDTTTVTVTLTPIATVTIVPGNITLFETGSTQLTAEVRASNGALLTNRYVDWAVADPAVATVTPTGPFLQTATLTAATCPQGQGSCTTTVTATADGIQGVATIVVQKPASTVDVVPASDTFLEGDTHAFAAVVMAADGTVLTDRQVNWSVSPSGQLSVVPTGAFGQSADVTAGNCPFGVTECQATLSATVGTVAGSADITVIKKVTQVLVTPATATVNEGGKASFQASAAASDGTPLTDRPATWLATGTAPVTITPSGPYNLDLDVDASTCPPGTPGTCQATLTATIDGVQGSATLLVVTPVATVEITPAAATVFEGGSTTFQATPKTANGDAIPDRLVNWTVTDPAIAAVTAAGPFQQTATANATATCPTGTSCSTTITAESEGKQATADILVLRPAAAITVTPASATLFEGETVDLSATVVTASNDTLTDRLVTWTSTGPATVAPAGTYQLSATVTAGTCPQGVPECTVTVTAQVEGQTFDVSIAVRKKVSTVNVLLSSGSLFEGESTQATAQVLAADGTVLQATVSWTVTAPFASVTPSSNTTADVAAGSCLNYVFFPGDPDADEDCQAGIVATADGVSGSTTITILKPVANVVVTPPAATLTTGQTQDFTASLFAADGAPVMNRGAAVVWKANPANVVDLTATTDPHVVTASPKSSGSATIEASITERSVKTSGTASVTVT